MKILRFHLLLLGLLALGSLSVQAAQNASAKVLEVEGSVFKSNDSVKDVPLQVGDILVEGDEISVRHLSSTKLVFSNGSLLTVKENSSISLTELKQESFSGNKSYEQLEADPSVSQNRLELNYGTVTGHVKKLRPGSDFMVNTPIGTAAIRGTVFSVELRYNKERNEMILVVENADGLVDIISQFSGEFDFGRGNIADKGYGNSSDESKRQAIPPRHKVVIRLSHDHPRYDDIIQVLTNYPPFQSEGQTPIIITLPGEDDDGQPPFTEDDPGVIIISPEA